MLEKREETSHQQYSDGADSIHFQPHSARRHPEGDEHPGGFLSGQISDVPPPQSKHSKNTSDVSLHWFDSIVGGRAKTEKDICELPLARTSQDGLTFEAPKNKPYSKEKNHVIEANHAEMGESLKRAAPGDSCRQAIVPNLDGEKKEKSPSFPSRTSHKDPGAAFPTPPDLVITQRASKKWQCVNIERSRGFCASTPDPKAGSGLAPFSPRHTAAPRFPTKDLNVFPSHSSSMNQKLVTSIRKRSPDRLKEGGASGSFDEPEIREKNAKLAKFLFRQKPKLAKSSENENCDRLRETLCSPESITRKVSKRERTREKASEMDQKEHSINNDNHRMEKRPCIISREEEQQRNTLSPPRTKMKGMREERAEGLSTKKLCSSTLEKLSRFSFIPAAESKPENPSSLIVSSCDKERPGLPLKNLTESTGRARKCFDLGEASKVTGKSLFSLADFDDASLDFDWDEEIKKNPRP